jgi:hypothetical protein
MWKDRLPQVERAWQDNQPSFQAAWQREQTRIEAGWADAGKAPSDPLGFLADAEQRYFAQRKDQHFASTYGRCLQDAAEIELYGRIQSSAMTSAARILAPETGAGTNDSAHRPPHSSGRSSGPGIQR